MELEKILTTPCISLTENFHNKEDVLVAISELAKKNPALDSIPQEVILKALQEREDLSSTGFGRGIAMPHCSLDIAEFVFGVITIKAGVNFDSIDDKPVQIVLFMIAPSSRRNQHIRYLSALSSMLSNELNRTKILQATSPDGIRGIFIRHTELESSANVHSWNIFNIFVQDEAILDDVLSLLTGIDDTNISIIDALPASHFLYSKPLFSSLWGSNQQEYCKIIIATVPGNRTNEIIRHCEKLSKDQYPEGLLVTVQDLSYLNGALNI
ncbi:MAG: PTS sugar transporter subunit IIA [Candidatus Cloacimonetes bacterium]|nr:PTS sugar transporter subunit IIA [Candidatus Cloacimonadota bacterium]